MSRYYPISLSLAGRLCVVVGGGAVAERKVSGLLEAGAQVRVVSPALTPALQEKARSQEIEVLLVRYEASCLTDAFLVFAATDDRAVNRQVAEDAATQGLLANIADAPEESDFLVPSTVRRGEFCLSVSTGGNTPMLAARVCDELEAQFGPEYADYVELLGRMRHYIKKMIPSPEARRRAQSRLLDAETELRAHLRAGQQEAAQELAQQVVKATLDKTT